MPGAAACIVAIADRPDLIDVVTGWLWHEFWRHDGYSLAETRRAVAASTARSGPPQAFVLLARGQPVGTASLVIDDLDERPGLTPWLAGVFVLPEARGRGYAARLVEAVEAAARAASIGTAWLYTNTAAGLYSRLGWRPVEVVPRQGKPSVTVMRKDFAVGRAPCDEPLRRGRG